MFRRKIYEELKEWKELDNGETALLIEGARRVGKTTVATEFAKNEYRSYMLIDFSEAEDDVMAAFKEHSRNLDMLFQKLQLATGVTLYERESVVIFDEVQFYPKARQLIKSLVKDRRYDYIETGSLIGLRRNVKNIRIPSEEHGITMYPMDFEEWLWANGDDTSAGILKKMFEERTPLGLHAHKAMMEKYKTYMVVGGMPQVVDRFLQTNNLMRTERAKNDIIALYYNDFMKLPDKLAERTQALFKGIPTLLSTRKKTFSPGLIMKGARSRSFSRAIDWLTKADISLQCRLCRDPSVAASLTSDASRTKLYLLDTGLLLTLAFGHNKKKLEETYKLLISGELSINEGMLFENAVAQQLASLGYELMFHEFRVGDSQLYEIDFILPGVDGVIPVEVKSSMSSRHKSLDAFMEKNKSRIEGAYVIHAKDLRVDGDVTYIPIYMTMFLRSSRRGPHPPEPRTLPVAVHGPDLHPGDDHPDRRDVELRTRDVGRDDVLESGVHQLAEDHLDVVEDVVRGLVPHVGQPDLPVRVGIPEAVDLLDPLVSHVVGDPLELGVDLLPVLVGCAALGDLGDRTYGGDLRVQMRPDADGQHLGVLRDGVVGGCADGRHAGVACEVLQMYLHALVGELRQQLSRNGIGIHLHVGHGRVPVLRDGPCVPLYELKRGMEHSFLHRVPRGYAVGVELVQLEVGVRLVGVEDLAGGNPHLLAPEHLPCGGPGDLGALELVQSPDGQDQVLRVQRGHDLAGLLVCPVCDGVGIPPLRAVALDGFHDGGCLRLLAGDTFAVVVLRLPQRGLLPVHREHRDPDVVLGRDVLRIAETRGLEQGEDPGEGLLRRDDPYPRLGGVLGTVLEFEHGSPPIDDVCRVMVVAPLLFQTAFNFASYPRVPGRSSPLCGLAPVGSRRFTKSRGTSPPDGSSCLPGLCRFCALATALAVSDFRIHLALGGGNFLSWLAPTVGRPPSPDIGTMRAC